LGYEGKPDVLNDISLTIYDDDFLGIIGPNGGGQDHPSKSDPGVAETTFGLDHLLR